MRPTHATEESLHLKRQIGLYAATAITVGSIVGSGIFRSPHSVAQEIQSVPVTIFAWILGGLLSLTGSLVLAELAVTHPRTGGLYVFIREGFGDRLGFVFGWASLWVIKPTVIASITSVFATYFCDAMGWPKGAELPSGIAAIAVLTCINWLGVRAGAGTQSLLSTLKVAGILLLCAAAFGLPHAAPASPALAGADPGAAGAAAGAAGAAARPFFSAFAVAMISILFAYDGWTDSTYVGGEIVNPKRNFPFAILGGTLLVVAVYVLTNLAYFAVLSPAEVASFPAVGSETMRRVLGDGGSRALAVLVAVSTFGCISSSILTGPRVTLAMAADGLFWRRAAHVNERRGTPDVALWLQGVLAVIWLACARGFEDVSGWFVTTSWVFYGLTIAALWVQRRREARGELPAPEYRTPLHPIPGVLFILVTAALIVSDLTASGWRAGAGLIVAALGFPVYSWMTGRRTG